MKQILGIAFGLVLSTAASSADMPPIYDTGPDHPWHKLTSEMPSAGWTGFYVGVQGGGAWGNYDYLFSPSPNVGSGLSGAIGGALLGYNWQVGRFVVGIEGDISASGISGTSTCPNPEFSCNAAVDWLGTVRGRVGLPVNNFLPYLTAGVAFGGMTRTSTSAISGNSLSQSATHTGWVAGGGIDFVLGDKWIVGGEVLYVDLGGGSYAAATVGTSTFSQVTIGSQFTVARARAIYRLP